MDNEAIKAWTTACDAVSHHGGSLSLEIPQGGPVEVRVTVTIEGCTATWTLHLDGRVAIEGVHHWGVDCLEGMAHPSTDDGDANLPWTY